MDRRSFLKLFGLAAPIAAVAPTYFFAPIGGWHSDVIFNPYGSDLQASALDDLVLGVAYDKFFVDDPKLEWMRTISTYAGGVV